MDAVEVTPAHRDDDVLPALRSLRGELREVVDVLYERRGCTTGVDVLDEPGKVELLFLSQVVCFLMGLAEPDRVGMAERTGKSILENAAPRCVGLDFKEGKDSATFISHTHRLQGLFDGGRVMSEVVYHRDIADDAL